MPPEPTPCSACKQPVVYVEGSLSGRRVACDALARSFVLTLRQPAYLADGTLVALEPGTVLSGHATHAPACPAKKKGVGT